MENNPSTHLEKTDQDLYPKKVLEPRIEIFSSTFPRRKPIPQTTNCSFTEYHVSTIFATINHGLIFTCVQGHRFSLLVKSFIIFKTGSTLKCRNVLAFDSTALTYLCFSVTLWYILALRTYF